MQNTLRMIKMRETWKYTVDKMRDIWNCEHTLSYRCSKMRRLSVKYYYTKGKAGAGMWKMK